ncbi:MAG: transcriptional regulator [Fibrella sp.]|nr:transcriptional regulator [Armatimonadota bacterium]
MATLLLPVTATPSPNSFSALLKQWRAERGFSLGTLAVRAGLSKSTLSRWEAGLRQPSMPELEAILAALTVTPSQRRDALAGIRAPRAVQTLRGSNSGDTMPPIAGDLLKALRRRSGRTLDEAARAVGVAHSTLLRWERGESHPSTEHLHALCHALGAHALEVSALTAGGTWLGLEGIGETLAVANPADRVAQLARQLDRISYHRKWNAETNALRDLGFLALEAALHSLAHRGSADNTVLHLLSHTYARHSQYLSEHARWQEAAESAARSLKTITPLFADGKEQANLARTAWPVAAMIAVRAAVELKKTGAARRTAAHHGARALTRWLEYAPGRPGYHGWLLSDIAQYKASCGDFDAALERGREACRSVESDPIIVEDEIVLRRRDQAALLTQADRSDEALALLQTVTYWQGQPIHRASEDLIWAEALWKTGDKNEAERRFHSAQATVEHNKLDSLRTRTGNLARIIGVMDGR